MNGDMLEDAGGGVQVSSLKTILVEVVKTSEVSCEEGDNGGFFIVEHEGTAP